jgi:preprotein translocase subunit SecB
MSTSHCIYTISSIIIRTNQQQLKTCNFQNIIIKKCSDKSNSPNKLQTDSNCNIYHKTNISYKKKNLMKGHYQKLHLSIAYILNSPIISVLTTSYYCFFLLTNKLLLIMHLIILYYRNQARSN